MTRAVSAVLLAAGEGTRMRSSRPKPLHVLCGKPMLLHVVDAVAGVPVDRLVLVVGHGAERVTKTVQDTAPAHLVVDFVEQHAPRGTGDAVGVGLTAFPEDDDDDGDLLVLPADTPLLRTETLASLLNSHHASDAACTVLSAIVTEPGVHGRVVHGKDDRVVAIVEADVADADELGIHEINTSIYCFRRSVVAAALRRLSPDNARGEYFLSDVIAVLHDAGYRCQAHVIDDPLEAEQVNDRVQLAVVESELRRRTNRNWMLAGVTMLDPERTYVDATVRLATDVTLFPGTMLQGHTVVGAGAEIGPDVRLIDCAIGEGAVVTSTTGRDAEIGAHAVVGPYAALRPGAQIAPGARTGPFYTAETADDDG
jgi:bifunctional UDP-N-acetylglucosamine pyrophosphorylase / glucosamine-1-phosphate N-acetyltransferase